MADFHELGAKGEEMASEYLIKKGFEILEKNWQSGHREIDIIAKKKNTLHIVEVKTRSAKFLETPESAVNRQKQKLLIQAANTYIMRKNLDMEVQFDIISIIRSGSNHTIEHIENAFYPIVGR